MKRPFAAFDIDGTIIRWQLYHAIADEFGRRGMFAPEAHQAIRQARMNWKKRTSDQAFRDYERTVVAVMDKAMQGLSHNDLQAACEKVITEYRDQVYTYTRGLIQDLKTQNYLLFAVSASHAEIVKLLAESYGFDGYAGSEYELVDGHYTGRKHVLLSEHKPLALAQLIKKHAASQKGSLAVGDSESDLPLLQSVKRPIAFNPTRILFEHARAQSWPIVIERKNMVYNLEADHGSYLLAQTNAD